MLKPIDIYMSVYTAFFISSVVFAAIFFSSFQIFMVPELSHELSRVVTAHRYCWSLSIICATILINSIELSSKKSHTLCNFSKCTQSELYCPQFDCVHDSHPSKNYFSWSLHCISIGNISNCCLTCDNNANGREREREKRKKAPIVTREVKWNFIIG